MKPVRVIVLNAAFNDSAFAEASQLVRLGLGRAEAAKRANDGVQQAMKGARNPRAPKPHGDKK
jgi:hypothetical protein